MNDLHRELIAWLNYRLLLHTRAKMPMYAGLCDCKEAQELTAILTDAEPTSVCMFCGKTIQMIRIPTFQEAMEQYKEVLPSIEPVSNSESPSPTGGGTGSQSSPAPGAPPTAAMPSTPTSI